MRTIKSSRKGKETFHSHFCPRPLVDKRITDCGDCSHLAGVKNNTSSYEIFCHLPYDDSLVQFKPSKAYAKQNLAKYMGADPMKVETHTIWQIKHDGARAIMHFTDAGIRVTTRRKNKAGIYTEITENLPHLADYVVPEFLVGMVLDSEILIKNFKDSDAAGTLGATMKVVGGSVRSAHKTQEEVGLAHFYVFDMPFGANADLRNEPYGMRFANLKHLMGMVDFPEWIHLIETHELTLLSEKQELLAEFLARGAEGCVAKDPDAKYDDRYAMLKIKEHVTIDALVTGFEFGKPGGKYDGKIGALLISVQDENSSLVNGKLQLVEVGKVIPGDDAKRDSLLLDFNFMPDWAHIEDLALIVEVEAQNWTKEYRLRHAKIVRYRPDRSEPEVVNFKRVVRK